MSLTFDLFEMREGFDKEIDSVLRRRARGAAGVRGDGGALGPGVGAHLDADELGAFAEGAMPAAARVAAAAHLADCDECRGIVVGLARASGFKVEPEKRADAPVAVKGDTRGAGWRAWASALFAPRVLRYAAPALALCLVGVVSFVALRSRRGADNTAPQVARSERRQAESPKGAAGAGAPESAATANANTQGLTAEAAGGLTSATTSEAPPVGRGHGAADAPPPVADTKDEGPPPPAPAPAPVTTAEFATEVAAPAAKAGVVEEQDAARAEEKKERAAREPAAPQELAASDQATQQNRANQARPGEAQMPDGSRNRAAGGGAAAPRAEVRESESARTTVSRRGRPTTLSETRRGDDETARAEETRSAAGHRFRREGGAWVDVNYRPSMPSTGVRRGSEAYRALVADLPEIGRVAEQIGGEVVVVVRGRAYRIR